MTYAFDPAPIPTLSVEGSEELIPVGRIFCVGRNYADHAREMGKDPDREPPFFFCKPSQAIVAAGADIPYPPETSNLHYEGELVVVIGKGGRDIALEDASEHVWGYAIGNDLTRRDLQNRAKEMGRPWEWGKAFDNSAVIGPVHPKTQVGLLDKGAITLSVNGDERQSGDLSDMIWDVNEVISILSQSMSLAAGDVIMTGTPAGVGAVVPGDRIVIAIEGLGQIENQVVA